MLLECVYTCDCNLTWVSLHQYITDVRLQQGYSNEACLRTYTVQNSQESYRIEHLFKFDSIFTKLNTDTLVKLNLGAQGNALNVPLEKIDMIKQQVLKNIRIH